MQVCEIQLNLKNFSWLSCDFKLFGLLKQTVAIVLWFTKVELTKNIYFSVEHFSIVWCKTFEGRRILFLGNSITFVMPARAWWFNTNNATIVYFHIYPLNGGKYIYQFQISPKTLLLFGHWMSSRALSRAFHKKEIRWYSVDLLRQVFSSQCFASYLQNLIPYVKKSWNACEEKIPTIACKKVPSFSIYCSWVDFVRKIVTTLTGLLIWSCQISAV